MLDTLAQANVVYLGETHDSPADHAAQLEIIQALHQRNPNLAIGMEMFQRPFQESIDQFLAGDITSAQLRQQTEYDRRWGFPWAYYAPILEYARTHQIPVLALNTPSEITRRVAEKGLPSLTPDQQQWIPPANEIDTEHPGYRLLLREIYDQFHVHHGSSADFENFVLAQVLWDETMAAGVAQFLAENSEHQVVVLAGQGHIIYGYGIPDRVARRMEDSPGFMQRSLLLNPSEADLPEGEGAIADYLWHSGQP